MSFINGLLITPKYPGKIYLEWSVFNPSINTNYFFNIYYSDNNISGWNKINVLPIPNITSYEFDFPLLFKSELLFIKLESFINDSRSESSSTFISNIPFETLCILKELQRKLDLVRENFTGVPCYIKKKKIIGTRCPVCVDTQTGFKIKNNCSICYGTGIQNGYSDPIDSVCEIVEMPVQQAPGEIGTTENIVSVIQITSPLLFKGDLVIEKQRNKRWYIQKVLEKNNFKTYIIDQKLDARQLSPKDIEYSIEI